MSAVKRKDGAVRLTAAQTRKLDQLSREMEDMKFRFDQAAAQAEGARQAMNDAGKRLDDFVAAIVGDEYDSKHVYRSRVEGENVIVYRDQNGDG